MIKSDIKFLEEDCIVETFPVLKNLNISGNPLESWEEIDKFRKFPSLENLRIADVPFLEVRVVFAFFMGCVTRKSVFVVSDQVRHKPGCTVT